MRVASFKGLMMIAFTNVKEKMPPIGKPLIVTGDGKKFYLAVLDKSGTFCKLYDKYTSYNEVTEWAQIKD